MNRKEIKIGRLEIRFNGGPPDSAQEFGAGIGEEVLKEIAQQINVARDRRSIRIARVDAGTLRLKNDPRASGSTRAIARQIAARVSSKVASSPRGGKR